MADILLHDIDGNLTKVTSYELEERLYKFGLDCMQILFNAGLYFQIQSLLIYLKIHFFLIPVTFEPVVNGRSERKKDHVYINDLPRATKNSTTSMYADDTCLYFQSKDLSRVNEALNEDLSHLDAWLVSNKLSLNVAKTKSILVSTKAKRKTLNKSNQNLQVNINGMELEVVSKIKLLGVLLDNSLDWKEQVQAVSLKVSRGLGILKHAKKFLPFSALTSLYTSIVEPHFRYCYSVWGCAGTTEINRLQKLQNRAARIVTNSSFDTPGNQLIEKLGRKTINELIDIESKTMVFKTLNELAPPYLCSLFRKNSQSTSYRLRNTSTDLRLPKKVQKTARNAFRLGV